MQYVCSKNKEVAEYWFRRHKSGNKCTEDEQRQYRHETRTNVELSNISYTIPVQHVWK